MSDPRQIVPVKREKIPRVEVYWTAVTYRTVAIYLLLLFAIIIAALYTFIRNGTPKP